MCISKYWKRTLEISTPPSFREATEFDFFRGQAGRKDRPDIHDDGCLASEPIRNMKGFADVGCIAMTRERWGAAKFVQGQMRLFVCNHFDFTPWLVKHQRIRAGCTFHMKHEDFLAVIKPMFPKDTETGTCLLRYLILRFSNKKFHLVFCCTSPNSHIKLRKILPSWRCSSEPTYW